MDSYYSACTSTIDISLIGISTHQQIICFPESCKSQQSGGETFTGRHIIESKHHILAKPANMSSINSSTNKDWEKRDEID